MQITRGDTLALCFQRKSADGEVITGIADEIYLTVKTSYNNENFVLQKTLADMTLDSDGTYHVVISAEETEQLALSKYVFDIEVTQDGVVTTIAKENLFVTEQATWGVNK